MGRPERGYRQRPRRRPASPPRPPGLRERLWWEPLRVVPVGHELDRGRSVSLDAPRPTVDRLRHQAETSLDGHATEVLHQLVARAGRSPAPSSTRRRP
jgi:hypothetical protein